MIVNANLNIHYTAPDWVWDKVDDKDEKILQRIKEVTPHPF